VGWRSAPTVRSVCTMDHLAIPVRDQERSRSFHVKRRYPDGYSVEASWEPES
jgi:hypothetical protein